MYYCESPPRPPPPSPSSSHRYYNPQVEEWTPDLVAIEARAKAEASSLLFVIDGQTRGLASMIEVSEYITSKRDIFVCVLDIPEGQVRKGRGRKRGGGEGRREGRSGGEESVCEGQQRL